MKEMLRGLFLFSILLAGTDMARGAMECPRPPLIMTGVNMNVAAHDPAAPIVLALDRAVDMVPYTDPNTGQKATAPYDFRWFLSSINIAGGRYGLGALLTGEYGSGGQVKWEGAQLIITPEAPLEPGTQYVLWVFKYISMGGEACPRLGSRVFIKTAGEAPNDGNPIREINLSAIWHGNTNGMQRLTGTVTDIHPKLELVSLDTQEQGKIQIILDDGSFIMKGEKVLGKSDLKPGDSVQAEFFGERLVWILVN